MTIDTSNGTPIFLQIADIIENDILKDILQTDEQVMSTNELARVYNINPNTAAKGINELFVSGILYKKRGIGMFVADGAKERILEKRRRKFSESYINPLVREAKVLRISKEQLVTMIMEDEV